MDRLKEAAPLDLLYRQFESDVEAWRKCRLAPCLTIAGFRLLANGFHTSARRQQGEQVCTFCGLYRDRTEHFAECLRITLAAFLSGLISFRDVEESNWLHVYAQGRFGQPHLPKKRRLFKRKDYVKLFPLWCYGLYEIHNKQRHQRIAGADVIDCPLTLHKKIVSICSNHGIKLKLHHPP